MRSFRHWTPRYVRDRVSEMFYRAANPEVPWLTPCAVQALDSFLRPADVGLEFGSGRSTTWFAKRVAHLTSVEHDEAWFAKVRQLLDQQRRSNVAYLRRAMDCPEEQADRSGYVGVLNDFAPASIDFVLVDGIYRDFCALGAIRILRPGGVLIVDNVNWFLPNRSHAPNSRTAVQGPRGRTWSMVYERIASWRAIWTTSGVTDTAMFIKPHPAD